MSINRALAAMIDWLNRDFENQDLTDLRDLPRFIQIHPRNVYFTLAATLACMSLGYGLNILTNLGGIVTFLGFIGSSVWFCQAQPWNEVKRVLLLMALGFCIGATLAPMADLLSAIGQGVITFITRTSDVGPLIPPLMAVDKPVAELSREASVGGPINSLITPNQRNVFLALIACIVTTGCYGFAARLSKNRPNNYGVGALLPARLLAMLLEVGSASNLIHALTIWLIVHVWVYNQLVVGAYAGDNHHTVHSVTFFTKMIKVAVAFAICCIGLRKLRSGLPIPPPPPDFSDLPEICREMIINRLTLRERIILSSTSSRFRYGFLLPPPIEMPTFRVDWSSRNGFWWLISNYNREVGLSFAVIRLGRDITERVYIRLPTIAGHVLYWNPTVTADDEERPILISVIARVDLILLGKMLIRYNLRVGVDEKWIDILMQWG